MSISFNASQFTTMPRGNSYNKNTFDSIKNDLGMNKNHAFGNKQNYIIYEKTDDMIYSGGSGNGMSFTVKYVENSSEENPIVLAKGMDENGKEFEQTFNLKDIDMTNASKVEMKALENHLKLVKGNSLSTLPMKTSRMGLGDKSDFIGMFENSIKEQITLGQYDVAMGYKTNLKFLTDFFKRN